MRPKALAAGGVSSVVVNAGDASIGLIANEQKAFAAGVRYDVMRNVALKAQFDVIRKPGSVAAPNSGSFTNTTATFKNNDQTVKLFTVAVDFVF